MRRETAVKLVLCVFLAMTGPPALREAVAADPVVAPFSGFVPVAVWELRRDGFPAIRHAWVAGSEKMLRVSWDDGATWYGFRPVFTDAARGLLALKLVTREELGRGEVAWRETAGVSLVAGQPSQTTFKSGSGDATIELSLELIEVKEVSPSELQVEAEAGDAAVDGGVVVPMAGGGGGLGSCCVSCQGVLVCDCSVCVVACHASCCRGGCFCLTC